MFSASSLGSGEWQPPDLEPPMLARVPRLTSGRDDGLTLSRSARQPPVLGRPRARLCARAQLTPHACGACRGAGCREPEFIRSMCKAPTTCAVCLTTPPGLSPFHSRGPSEGTAEAVCSAHDRLAGFAHTGLIRCALRGGWPRMCRARRLRGQPLAACIPRASGCVGNTHSLRRTRCLHSNILT